MNFSLKPLYLNRIKTLKTEINNNNIYIKNKCDYLLECNNIILEYTNLLKEILSDVNLDINNRYIQMMEKSNEIEKIVNVIQKTEEDIISKQNNITKSTNLLIQNCLEDHPNLTENVIEEQIIYMLNN
jgi:hypothetical protein